MINIFITKDGLISHEWTYANDPPRKIIRSLKYEIGSDVRNYDTLDSGDPKLGYQGREYVFIGKISDIVLYREE